VLQKTAQTTDNLKLDFSLCTIYTFKTQNMKKHIPTIPLLPGEVIILSIHNSIQVLESLSDTVSPLLPLYTPLSAPLRKKALSSQAETPSITLLTNYRIAYLPSFQISQGVSKVYSIVLKSIDGSELGDRQIKLRLKFEAREFIIQFKTENIVPSTNTNANDYEQIKISEREGSPDDDIDHTSNFRDPTSKQVHKELITEEKRNENEQNNSDSDTKKSIMVTTSMESATPTGEITTTTTSVTTRNSTEKEFEAVPIPINNIDNRNDIAKTISSSSSSSASNVLVTCTDFYQALRRALSTSNSNTAIETSFPYLRGAAILKKARDGASIKRNAWPNARELLESLDIPDPSHSNEEILGWTTGYDPKAEFKRMKFNESEW